MCSEVSFPATEINEKTGTVVWVTQSGQASNLTFAWNSRDKQTNKNRIFEAKYECGNLSESLAKASFKFL